jgi:hypothetical protein
MAGQLNPVAPSTLIPRSGFLMLFSSKRSSGSLGPILDPELWDQSSEALRQPQDKASHGPRGQSGKMER